MESNTHTTLPRQPVLDALYEAGLEEDALREDYSGRAMYGATCFGVVCELNEMLQFVVALSRNTPDHDEMDAVVYDLVRSTRSDGMGLSSIWYWPGWAVEAEEGA